MRFFRVYCKCGYSQFGEAERLENIDREIGDIIENVYATPHAQCAANMVAWNNDKAFEFDGGHISDSAIIIIESDDYYKPERNSCFDSAVDADEVVIRTGKVIGKYGAEFEAYRNFANDFNVEIEGMYSCCFYPQNKTKEVAK